MKSKILFIESSDIGLRYSARAAIELGFEPIFLCNLNNYQADPLSQLQEFRHYHAVTDNIESLLEVVEREQLENIAGVISLMDIRMPVAAELAIRLGVHGTDPAVIRTKDKVYVSTLIPEFSPAFCQLSSENLTDNILLAKFLRSFSRIVVKPASGAGAVGVGLFEKPSLNSLRGFIEQEEFRDLKEVEWIAQQSVQGELVSAEGYVLRGQEFLLGFTNRRKVNNTESGAAFPADATLTGAAQEKFMDAIRALTQRSGFLNGYFHVECIVQGDNCVVIDANLGRIGGGPVGELLATSFAIDPIEVYKHVIEVTLFGSQSKNPFSKRWSERQPAYAVLYGMETAGVVDDVVLPAELPVRHTRLVGNGSFVSQMGHDDWSWIGILTGLTNDVLNSVGKLRVKSGGKEIFPAF